MKSQNLAIANYTDTENIKNIYSQNGTYLFSVKLSEGKHDNIFINIQFICWIFASFFFLLFVHNICFMMAKSGKPWLSIAFFAFILILTLCGSADQLAGQPVESGFVQSEVLCFQPYPTEPLGLYDDDLLCYLAGLLHSVGIELLAYSDSL